MAGDGVAGLKLCSGIQNMVRSATSAGTGVNSGGRMIRRRGYNQTLGHVSIPAGAKSEIQKPTNTNSSEEGCVAPNREGWPSHGKVSEEVKMSGLDVVVDLTSRCRGLLDSTLLLRWPRTGLQAWFLSTTSSSHHAQESANSSSSKVMSTGSVYTP